MRNQPSILEFDDELDDGDEVEEESLVPFFEQGPHLAYIRPIDLKEAYILGMVVPKGVEIPRDAKLFALRAADGTTLGITDDWNSAYAAAVENNFVPLSVH